MGAGTGGSVPMNSEKPRKSASVINFPSAIIASLLRRPSRNRNSCVIAYSECCPASTGVPAMSLRPLAPWQAAQTLLKRSA